MSTKERFHCISVTKLGSLCPLDSSVLGLHRELLLILQWVNFQHEPSDLYLLFAGDFYSKVVTISGVVSSRVQEDISLPSSHLVERLNMSCVFANQLLALRVG